MKIRFLRFLAVALFAYAASVFVLAPSGSAHGPDDSLDQELAAALAAHGFTGRVEQTLSQRLGRRVDHKLADLGRLAFHDSLLGLNDDNSCAGCHAATAGFGDSQSIAIGVENNN